ncbi:putative bifunctional diguanylate cyclase/phosphodiesterase [Egibacter rhizosphaerae]|nr:EAL domain-containing protein [Egibacter rhizosphaerae]
MTTDPESMGASGLRAENARLREQLSRAEQHTDAVLLRTTRLAQVVTALEQIGPSGRINRIAGEVAQLFSADIGLLLLGKPDALMVASRWGVPDDELPDGPHRAPDPVVATPTTEPALVGPCGEAPLLCGLENFDVRQVAWIRLHGPEETTGYLLLGRQAEAPFTNSDAHELRAVGARVALTVENEKLQRRTQEQLEQLRILHQLSMSLAGTVDLAEGGRLVADTVVEVAPGAAAALFRRNGQQWQRFAAAGAEVFPEHLDDPPDLEAAELLSVRDGAEEVAVIALCDVPAAGLARALLPHLRDAAGLALGKMLLHEQTARQARHDALTGLPNREHLRQRLETALRQGRTVAVIFLDLDRFKLINDSLGHDVGDELLVEAARRLSDTVRGRDLVARLGGDEFVVLCEGPGSDDEAVSVAQRIAERMAMPFEIAGTSLRISTSQGLAIAGPASTAQTLLRDADAAMYLAKSRGRDRYEIFQDELRVFVTGQLTVEQELRAALSQQRLQLWYEPVTDLRTGAVAALSARLHYEDERGRCVPAADFLSVAEESELIVELGLWALDSACAHIADWRAELGGHEPPRVQLPLTTRQFAREDLVSRIRQALEAHDLPATALGFEIDEHALLQADEDRARHVVGELRRLGMHPALDGFGAGSASLTRLKGWAVRSVTLGDEFARELHEDPDAPVTRAMVQLVHDLGREVTAQRVGDPAQLEALRQAGCDYARGRVFGPPQPPGEIAASLREQLSLTTG